MEDVKGSFNATVRQLRASTWGAGADRDDLIQEAIARALARDVSPDAVPWLRTVVRRLAIDRARRSYETPGGDGDEVGALVGSVGLDPGDQVVSRETCEEIVRALDSLPPRYRDALIAFVEEGERPAMVAHRLGLSPSATWTLLSRARSRLRARLREVGVVPAVVWGKVGRWVEPATNGAVAVGVAVSLALAIPAASPADAMEIERPPVKVATETPIEAPAVEPQPPAPAHVEHAEPAVYEDLVSEDAVEVPFDYGVRACTPAEEDGPSVAGGVRFEDRGSSSLSGAVVEHLPLTIREEEVDACPR